MKIETSWSSNSNNNSELVYITDTNIISIITNEENWQGNFIGTVPVMPLGARYIDINNGYVYEFDGVNLVRYSINNLNL